MHTTSVLLISADTGESAHWYLGRIARPGGAFLAEEFVALEAPGQAVLARRTVVASDQRWFLFFTTARPRKRRTP